MGKYPVVFLSLKGVDGLNFEDAKDNFRQLIGNEAERFSFLRNSEKLSENEKKKYQSLVSLNGGRYTMNGSELTFSLQTLSQLLYRHYGQKSVILIDEYDVPLDKAFQNGYYQEMVSLLRGFFGQALKTNEFLQFAVLTGCLRVSKESIFTGLNNFEINSIVDIEHDEQFGFTEDEVHKLLEDYQLTEYDSDIKEWYDGYRFGDTEIYCPWDVVLPELGNQTMFSYWQSRLTDIFIEDIKNAGGILCNLASDEMKSLFDWKRVEKEVRVITPEFQVWKNGKWASVVIYIKMSRGEMTRFVLKNKIENPEELKHFSWEGFEFNESLSDEKKFVFTNGKEI